MKAPTPGDIEQARKVQRNYLAVREAIQRPITPGGDTVEMSFMTTVVDAIAYTLAMRGWEQVGALWLRQLPDGSYRHFHEPEPDPDAGTCAATEIWSVTPRVTINDEESPE